MAKDKKSFILYADQISLFEKLTDEEAGRLVKHLFEYVNDRNPEPIDRITEITFEPIKQQLKRDLKNWEETRESKSKGGKIGMEKRWGKHNKDKQEISEDNLVIKNITPITVNGNVNDTVNGNVNEIKSTVEQRKLKFASTLEPFQKIYPKKMLSDFYKYWCEMNRSGTKFKQELEQTWDLERRLEMWARRDKEFSNGQTPSSPLSFSSKNMHR
jgi:hypothetical protein